jgi:hypothetical protein
MPFYRDKDAQSGFDDLLVIEDATMLVRDGSGYWRPSFRFVDENLIRAHPLIIDSLLANAEPLWSLEEIFGELSTG